MAEKYIAIQGEEVLTAAPDLDELKASLASMTRLRTLMNVDVYKLDRTWRPTVRVDFGDELVDAPLPKADDEDREWCTINEHRWRMRGRSEPFESEHCVRCGQSYGSSASAPFKSSICEGFDRGKVKS